MQAYVFLPCFCCTVQLAQFDVGDGADLLVTMMNCSFRMKSFFETIFKKDCKVCRFLYGDHVHQHLLLTCKKLGL